MEPAQPTWALVCRILSNHFKGAFCEAAVDRLWRKKPKRRHRPKIDEKSATIYFERWELPRLWALIGPESVTEKAPHSIEDPPVIVRWCGRDYRLDGRRRINKMQREHKIAPHLVVILDIGDAPGRDA
jgi:hypothetical protein